MTSGKMLTELNYLIVDAGFCLHDAQLKGENFPSWDQELARTYYLHHESWLGLIESSPGIVPNQKNGGIMFRHSHRHSDSEQRVSQLPLDTRPYSTTYLKLEICNRESALVIHNLISAPNLGSLMLELHDSVKPLVLLQSFLQWFR